MASRPVAPRNAFQRQEGPAKLKAVTVTALVRERPSNRHDLPPRRKKGLGILRKCARSKLREHRQAGVNVIRRRGQQAVVSCLAARSDDAIRTGLV
jgi:hypothetical protein